MKTKFKMLILALVSILTISTVAFAASNNMRQGNTVTVSSSEEVTGAAFYSGNEVLVDANIDGTAFVAGNNVTVNGDVNGDLFVAGNNVTVGGTVNGNIYGAGSNVTIKGAVERDAFLAGNIVTLPQGANIGRDLLVGAATADLQSEIGRNASISVDNLIAGENLKIGGNLDVTSSQDKDPAVESKVAGTTNWNKVAPTEKAKEVATSAIILALIKKIIFSTLGALVLWAVVRFLKPLYWKKNRITGENNIGKSLGIGLVSLIVLPIVFVILLITVIGIPTSIIGGLLLAITIYISKIVVAEVIGNKIIKPKYGKELHYGVWAVLAGLLIINIITSIPFIGILISILVTIFGVGAILLRLYNERKEIPVDAIPSGEAVIEKQPVLEKDVE